MSTVPFCKDAPVVKVSRTRKIPLVFPALPGDLHSGVSMVDGIARIPHYEAYRVLAAALTPEAAAHAPALRDELPAIATHWLQSPTPETVLHGLSA
jgi:hypothetical protein